MTQVMASATLLLPQPLGPTMAVTPLSKASSDRSEKDLKPCDFEFFETHELTPRTPGLDPGGTTSVDWRQPDLQSDVPMS
ncbi:MAG: hypothetical protein QM736_26950 [Vicinamibacterales bacterium]